MSNGTNDKHTIMPRREKSQGEEVYSRMNGLQINYYVILGILAAIVLFQVFVEFNGVDDFLGIGLSDSSSGMFFESSLYSVIGIILETIIVGFTIYLAYRYDFSKIMGRPYLLFAGGFASIVLGKVLLYTGAITTYPPINTLFFFGMYVGVGTFLFIQIRHYNAGFGIKNTLIAGMIVAGLVAIFYSITYSYTGQSNFDLHYCGMSVFGTAMIAALSVVGAKKLRKNPVGRAWIIMMYGLIALTLSDVWFHFLDTAYLYHDTHMVNASMFASYMIIIYGLYKHVKVF